MRVSSAKMMLDRKFSERKQVQTFLLLNSLLISADVCTLLLYFYSYIARSAWAFALRGPSLSRSAMLRDALLLLKDLRAFLGYLTLTFFELDLKFTHTPTRDTILGFKVSKLRLDNIERRGQANCIRPLSN
jgi:hypothetical protein